MDSLATEQAPAAHIQLRRRHRACQATLGALGHSRHQQRRLKQAVVNPERDVGFSTAHRFLDTGTLPVCNSCGIVHGWSENVPGRPNSIPARALTLNCCFSAITQLASKSRILNPRFPNLGVAGSSPAGRAIILMSGPETWVTPSCRTGCRLTVKLAFLGFPPFSALIERLALAVHSQDMGMAEWPSGCFGGACGILSVGRSGGSIALGSCSFDRVLCVTDLLLLIACWL